MSDITPTSLKESEKRRELLYTACGRSLWSAISCQRSRVQKKKEKEKKNNHRF